MERSKLGSYCELLLGAVERRPAPAAFRRPQDHLTRAVAELLNAAVADDATELGEKLPRLGPSPTWPNEDIADGAELGFVHVSPRAWCDRGLFVPSIACASTRAAAYREAMGKLKK